MKKTFGSLPLCKKALMIGIPVLLQSLMQSLVSLADDFMAAGRAIVNLLFISSAGSIPSPPWRSGCL